MQKNQYSFPKKGCPIACVNFLDSISQHLHDGKKVVVALFDYSNGFCTPYLPVALKIAKKYNLSDRALRLFKDFLKQNMTILKISDKNGYYFSPVTDMERGGQQGQLFVDFLFAIVNDGINPISFFDEIIENFKYVDDTLSIYAANSATTIFKSLDLNLDRMLKQSTAVGLKLNDDKTAIMPINISNDECDPRYEMKTEKRFLGLDLVVNKNKISLEKAAKNVISRLNGACKIIFGLRKCDNNLKRRLESASSLVYSSIYDLGIIYVYAPNRCFEDICTCIRKVIKTAGLDRLTPREVVYALSIRVNPESIALKQILQMGLKVSLDKEYCCRVNKKKLGIR